MMTAKRFEAEALRQSFDFKKEENWRWTPSEALFLERDLSIADYEFSLADGVTDDWQKDEQPQDLARDLPLAHHNFAALQEAFTLSFTGEVEDVSVVALNATAQQWQSSRIRAHWATGAGSALCLNYNAQEKSAQNGVIRLSLAEDAQADVLIDLQGENQTAQNLTILVEQEARSQLKLNVLQLQGSAFQRVDVRVILQGEEADLKIGGMQALKDEEMADLHVAIRHEAPNCTSQQVVRGALAGQSLGTFDGMIYVAQIAQKTDAQQDSRYILHEKARSQSMPRLEIYADDVQCAHGSTTGELDAEALFYLQSRGIAHDVARTLLLGSFLQESIIVEHEALRQQVLHILADLGYGEIAES